MADFKQALAKTLEHEGGYVNDPLDRGGETFMGISRKAHPQSTLWELLAARPDPRSVATLNDPEVLTEVQAIYREEYWEPNGCGAIHDQCVAEMLFDFSVHSGRRTVAKLLQETVGLKSGAADGFIGPVTLAAINAEDPGHLACAFALVRIGFYANLRRRNPKGVDRFFAGWVNRVLETI